MIRIEPVTALDLRLADDPWAFAVDERPAIDAYWQKIVTDKSTLWNGNVLLCRQAAVVDGRLSARFLKTDYASFIAWRDWGRPDPDVASCFGVPAVFSSDGALLVGVMGAWTLNAGKAYPPSGSLEPRDVRDDGSVDIEGSMRTELLEETGLDLAHSQPGDMVAIFEGGRIAVARRHGFPRAFSDMQDVFSVHAGNDERPELDRIEPIWNASQIDSRMPVYAKEIIRYFVSP